MDGERGAFMKFMKHRLHRYFGVLSVEEYQHFLVTGQMFQFYLIYFFKSNYQQEQRIQ